MTSFHDLFRQPTRRVGASFPPDRRRELFPGFVERSPRLHLWANPSDFSVGSNLLIGVATWSGFDMNLLDVVEEVPENGVRIETLDVDAVAATNRDTLAALFPGVGLAQTPFVSLWVDGKLCDSASGFEGRQLVARVLNLNAEELDSRMLSVHTRH